MRNLMALYAAAPKSAYRRLIDTNVNSILANDQSAGHEFGALWQGPFDSADPTGQTSALDALIAGIAVQNLAPSGSIARHIESKQHRCHHSLRDS